MDKMVTPCGLRVFPDVAAVAFFHIFGAVLVVDLGGVLVVLSTQTEYPPVVAVRTKAL